MPIHPVDGVARKGWMLNLLEGSKKRQNVEKVNLSKDFEICEKRLETMSGKRDRVPSMSVILMILKAKKEVESKDVKGAALKLMYRFIDLFFCRMTPFFSLFYPVVFLISI